MGVPTATILDQIRGSVPFRYSPIATEMRTSLVVRFVPLHEVAALQPAAREQEPRGR
jgi:hypothetical protein